MSAEPEGTPRYSAVVNDIPIPLLNTLTSTFVSGHRVS
jgi:hypothetical protein